MPAQANANVVALQLEKVRDKVPLLYERDDILLTMIQQRGNVEKVSSRNMRLPLQVNPGGKAGSYNADAATWAEAPAPPTMSPKSRRCSSASRLKSRSWWNTRRPAANAPSKTLRNAKSPTE